MFTFDEFIQINRNYKGYLPSQGARACFERICDPENILFMIYELTNDRPALTGCVREVENIVRNYSDFDLSERFARSCVGAMVSYVLRPFGYMKYGRDNKKLPSNYTNFFREAAFFKKTIAPTCEIRKQLTIVRI